MVKLHSHNLGEGNSAIGVSLNQHGYGDDDANGSNPKVRKNKARLLGLA